MLYRDFKAGVLRDFIKDKRERIFKIIPISKGSSITIAPRLHSLLYDCPWVMGAWRVNGCYECYCTKMVYWW